MYRGATSISDLVDLEALPGHLAARLNKVKAHDVTIQGNQVFFKAGMFRFVTNWNVLVPFGLGILTIDAMRASFATSSASAKW